MNVISDFREFYDYAFVDCGPGVFRRMSTEGPSKREQFEILKSAGYQIPLIGCVRDIMPKSKSGAIVIYDDEDAHCGEGKRLVLGQFNEEDADKFCSEYIGNPIRPGVSMRLLQFGSHRVFLEYRSLIDWRSNVGDGDIQVTKIYRDIGFGTIEYPLYAIDMVEGAGKIFAIDFNIAPGMSGTGIQSHFYPSEIAKAIAEAVVYFENRR